MFVSRRSVFRKVLQHSCLSHVMHGHDFVVALTSSRGRNRRLNRYFGNGNIDYFPIEHAQAGILVRTMNHALNPQGKQQSFIKIYLYILKIELLCFWMHSEIKYEILFLSNCYQEQGLQQYCILLVYEVEN